MTQRGGTERLGDYQKEKGALNKKNKSVVILKKEERGKSLQEECKQIKKIQTQKESRRNRIREVTIVPPSI